MKNYMFSKFNVVLVVFLFFCNLVAEDICTFSYSDLEGNINTIEKHFELNFTVDDIDSRKQDCFDTLSKVIENEEWDCIEELKTRLTGVKNNRGDSLFIHFISLGKTKVVESIIKKGLVELLLCGDTIKDSCPLHRAIRTDSPDLINLLLNNGIGWINQKDKSGKTPLYIAIDAKFADIVKFLIKEKGSSLTDSVPILINDVEVDFFPLHYCVRSGDIDSLDVIIEYLLDDGKDAFISKNIKKIGNILHVAINFNRYDLLEHLLTEYIDETKILLDKENDDDETPLILATILGDDRSIKLLHDKGVDLDQEIMGGKRAIHFAAENGQKRVILLLNHLGADIHAEDSSDRSRRAIDLVANLQDFSSVTTHNLLLNVSKAKESCKRPRNLILSGFIAGETSLPYLGAIKLLEEKEMIDDVWRIAAFSDSARAAVLFAVGYSADEINDIIEKDVDELIFDKLGIENCTFGELRQRREQGENVKHIYFIASDESGQRSVFNSEDEECDDLVVSSVVTKRQFILHYKDREGEIYSRDDKGFFKLCDDVPVGFFDRKKFIKKGFSKSEENHPVFNSKTLAIFVNSNHIEDRILNIDIDETSSNDYFQLGYDIAKQFFKNQHYDSSLFSCYSFDYDKSGFISIKNKHPNFVGRGKDIELLEDKLLTNTSWQESSHPIALCGLGGMGKSELAIYFANINRNHFHNVFWIDASSEDSLNQAYRLLGEKLKINLSDSPDNSLVRERVFSKLENNKSDKPWLLVYDNVEQKLEYPQRGGCILVTSRKQEYKGKRLWSNIIPIEPLTHDESIDLLRKITGQHDKDNMVILAERFGGFPLALSNAASYITNTHISIAEFVEDLPDLMYWDLDEEERYDQTLEYIYEMTIKDLEANCPQAIEWLNICSYFHHEAIPRDWIKDWLEREKNLPSKDVKQSARRIFRLLSSYNLVRRDKTTNTFSLHNLTQEYVRKNQQDEKKSFLSAFHIINKCRKKFEPHNPHTWENGHGRLWMIHAQNTLNVDMVNEEIENDLDDIYFYLGAMLGMSADYKKSVFYYEKALAMAQNTDPNNHLKRAGWLFELGSTLQRIGDSSAEDKFRESLSICEGMIDLNDFAKDKVLSVYNIAVNAASALGDFGKAFYHQSRVLKYIDSSCNDENGDEIIKARELFNMAGILSFLNDYENSLIYLDKALEIFENTGNPLHFDIAILLYKNRGQALTKLFRRDEALESFKKAFNMTEEALTKISGKITKKQQCEMIDSAYKLVIDCLVELGRCEEAIPYLKKAAHYCNNDEVNMEYFWEVCR